MSVLLEICRPFETSTLGNPFADTTIRPGLPAPVDDFLDNFIDMNQELVKNKEATFYARIVGNAGGNEFSEGDVLVVDRSLPLQKDKMAVCFLDGNFTLKKIRLEEGTLWVESLNASFDAIRITEDNQFMVWGMVTYTVKQTW
jgi:DNA polymerase V